LYSVERVDSKGRATLVAKASDEKTGKNLAAKYEGSGLKWKRVNSGKASYQASYSSGGTYYIVSED